MHNNNGNRVDYAIIDKFEFTAVVEKYDTFITHTNNYEETSATMVTIYEYQGKEIRQRYR